VKRVKGCLLIHGFTGSPYEISPLADHLKQHTDWLIETPTLAGHGERASLSSSSWKDWIASAEHALQKMIEQCDEVFVIGFSMGGLIAAHLATTYPISKLILLSPAVYYIDTQRLMKEVSETVKAFFQDQSSAYKIIQRYKHKMRSTPLKSVMNFKKLVKELRSAFDNVEVPVLIIHGEKDNIAQPKGAHYVYEKVQSKEKEILFLKNSKHVICRDCESEIIFNKVDQFLHDESYLY
jgi:carboxylesterase